VKLSTEEIDKILELYNKKVSCAKISKIYKVSINNIKDKLIKRGIVFSNRIIPKNIYESIIHMYTSGMNAPEIARIYKFSNSSIVNLLKRNNIERRHSKENARRYPVIESYFDIIDTQEKAYFLGFLYADGCNHNCKSISMNLSVIDKNFLDKLNKLIHPEGKPLYMGKPRKSLFKNRGYIINTKENYSMIIENAHIAQKLNEYGCVPRKSLILTFPEWLSTELVPHFIRGYFDGDGSMSMYGNKGKIKNQAYVSIVSSLLFVNRLKEILKDTLEIDSSVLSRYKNPVGELRIVNTQYVKKFLNWIYKDSTIYLPRKYENYLKFKMIRDEIENRPKPVCKVCGGKYYGLGYCTKHYQQYYMKNKRIQFDSTNQIHNYRVCSICGDLHYCNGLCMKHYTKDKRDKYREKNPLPPRKKSNKKCLLCDFPHKSKGYCKKHYDQLIYYKKKKGIKF
jgi:hypothetical protein